MVSSLHRRDFLLLAGSAALAGAMPFSAWASADDVAVELETFLAGAEPQEGRLVLDIAETVENGSAVPVTLSLDSPMDDEDRVEAMILLAERNPRPIVASFHFTPLSGAARASTRVRLADSQTLIAAARMTDGSVYVARRTVDVAIGGCITS
jgi:sulfur-oxidizing protein SoxY